MHQPSRVVVLGIATLALALHCVAAAQQNQADDNDDDHHRRRRRQATFSQNAAQYSSSKNGYYANLNNFASTGHFFPWNDGLGEDGKENYCPVLIDSANVLPNFAHSISTQDQAHGVQGYNAVFEEHRKATRIFLHQNKNAGTSLKVKLGLKDNGTSCTYHDFVNESRRFCRISDASQPKQVYGGYVMGMRACPQQRQKISIWTVFRDPISRLTSSFRYCSDKRIKDQLCGKKFLAQNGQSMYKMTIEDWARHWGNYSMFQLLLHPALNLDETPNWRRPWIHQKIIYDSLSAETQESILNHLRDRMKNILGVVLILEDWKTSTQVLGTIYDLDHGLVASLDFPGHVTTTSREELDDQFLIKKASESPLIKQLIRADQIIYDEAKEIMAKQKTILQALDKH